MKKKILTLGLFVAMMLGSIGAKPSTVICVGFDAPCGAGAVACGSTLQDLLENAALMAEYACMIDPIV